MWITWISTYFMRLPLAYALSGVDIYRTVISPEGEEIKRIFFENPFPHIEGITGTLGGLWLGLCLEPRLRNAESCRTEPVRQFHDRRGGCEVRAGSVFNRRDAVERAER